VELLIGLLLALVCPGPRRLAGVQDQAQAVRAIPGFYLGLEPSPCRRGCPRRSSLLPGDHGDRIPVVGSAVISGRAQMRVFGIPLPARFRFTHQAGHDYRHYIEVTLFGLPVFKVNEHYLDGKSRLELPMGVVENEPKVDQAANLGLWAESIWLPSIWITDPRVRWDPADEQSALLRVPFGQAMETFVVRFDPQSGMVTQLEAMRWRDGADDAKTLWIGDSRSWGQLDGRPTLLVSTLTWFDQGSPWATFNVEEVLYNADVRDIQPAGGRRTWGERRASGPCGRRNLQQPRRISMMVARESEDDMLAQRIRPLLAGHPDLVEKWMFGGIGFLVQGNMACGVHKGELIVRVGTERYAESLARPHVREPI
jgi:hypothetical protein